MFRVLESEEPSWKEDRSDSLKDFFSFFLQLVFLFAVVLKGMEGSEEALVNTWEYKGLF